MCPGEPILVDSRGKPSLPKDASWSLESCPTGKAPPATSGKYRDSSGFPQEAAVAQDLQTASVARHRDDLTVVEVVDEGFQDMEAKPANVRLGKPEGRSCPGGLPDSLLLPFCGRSCGNLSRVDFQQRRWT